MLTAEFNLLIENFKMESAIFFEKVNKQLKSSDIFGATKNTSLLNGTFVDIQVSNLTNLFINFETLI